MVSFADFACDTDVWVRRCAWFEKEEKLHNIMAISAASLSMRYVFSLANTRIELHPLYYSTTGCAYLISLGKILGSPIPMPPPQ